MISRGIENNLFAYIHLILVATFVEDLNDAIILKAD